MTAAPGELADPAQLVDVDALIAAYYDRVPDPGEPGQRVSFGTSGHRGSAFNTAFNEAHILAMSEAICRGRGTRGHCSSAAIPTRCRSRRSGQRWKCWPRTAWTSASTPPTATPR